MRHVSLLAAPVLLVLTLVLSACQSNSGDATRPGAPASASANATMASPLSGVHWRLVALRGAPIPAPADGMQDVHIVLTAEDAQMSGFAGCNRIMGSYTLGEGNRIAFTQIASTKRACLEDTPEDAFLEALGQVDNYHVDEKNLVLNRARMAPLLRFEAVAQP